MLLIPVGEFPGTGLAPSGSDRRCKSQKNVHNINFRILENIKNIPFQHPIHLVSYYSTVVIPRENTFEVAVEYLPFPEHVSFEILLQLCQGIDYKLT